MTTSKSLPTRPSQESLRKQAKKLVRDISAGNAAALARARAQLPDAPVPPSQRDAQLVVAREYGFAGWQDLSAEVRRRLGKGVEWALVEAGNAIHENDVERLNSWSQNILRCFRAARRLAVLSCCTLLFPSPP